MESANNKEAAKLIQLTELIDPATLGKIPSAKAVGIVRQALAQLGKQLNSVDSGLVKVSGLGNFRIRQVEKEMDGKKVVVRKVAFRVVEPKVKAKNKTV